LRLQSGMDTAFAFVGHYLSRLKPKKGTLRERI
jgi:hypothetical protein